MSVNEICKMIEMFTRSTAIRICIVRDDTRKAEIYCIIPIGKREDFNVWKRIVLAAIRDLVAYQGKNLLRARASGKDEITLYFDEGVKT